MTLPFIIAASLGLLWLVARRFVCIVTSHAWEIHKASLHEPAHGRCVTCRRRVPLDTVLRRGWR